MYVVLLFLAAAPVTLDCELHTNVEDPRRIFLRAPASWAVKADLTGEAKKKVVAFLYEGANAKVRSFRCSALKGKIEHLDGYLWLEVKADGALDFRGPEFGPPEVKQEPVPEDDPPPRPPEPEHPAPGLSRGAPVSDAKVLLDWLSKKTGVVMLPVRLKHGPDRFTGRGAKVGALEVQCDGLDERARKLCAGRASCALWVVGEWQGGTQNVFTLKEVAELVTGDEPVNMSSYAWVPN